MAWLAARLHHLSSALSDIVSFSYTQTLDPSTTKCSGDGFKTDCAWTASASYKTANLFFPDAQSIYHVMYFSQFGPTDMAMYVRRVHQGSHILTRTHT